MTVVMSRFVFVALALSIAWGADLKSKIDELVVKSSAVTNAFAGLQVVSLPSGRVLYERNQDRLFTPASNMKLFTTALALGEAGSAIPIQDPDRKRRADRRRWHADRRPGFS